MIMYLEIEVDASIAVIICQMADTSVYVIEALLWIQRTRKNVLTSMNVRRYHVGKEPFVKTPSEHSNANVHPVLQETQQ